MVCGVGRVRECVLYGVRVRVRVLHGGCMLYGMCVARGIIWIAWYMIRKLYDLWVTWWVYHVIHTPCNPPNM